MKMINLKNKSENRIFVKALVFVLLMPFAFAAEPVDFGETDFSEPGIELPDLTTIISGSELFLNSESIPDFSTVIPVENVQSKIQLELPDVSYEDNNSSIFMTEIQADKGIFAEGKIGGGYPGSFIGDFSIMQDRGTSPFEIFYSHSSFEGYNRNPLYSGYNDNSTTIKINKTMNIKKQEISFGGFYETLGNGLQNKVENISAINQRNINGNLKYQYDITENLYTGVNFSTDYYTRFANLSLPVENSNDLLTWFKNYSYWNLNPEAYLTWNNSMFEAGLSGSYIFNGDFLSEYVVNRGEILGNAAWHNSLVNVSVQAGFLFSNQLLQNFLVPFNIGVTYSFPVYFSDRKISIAGEGGLFTKQNSIAELEKNYKFTCLNVLPGETSDWYGKFNFTVPIKLSFTINGEMEYRHTAFENGVFEPVYTDESYSNGVYRFIQKGRQLLNSELEFVYHYKLFAVSAGWYASWLDIPALGNAQGFKLSLALQNEQSIWGVNLTGRYNLDASDLIPFIDFEAFVRLNNAVRLVLTVDDGIKLVTGQERVYAGKYITQSGSANLLVKFFF